MASTPGCGVATGGAATGVSGAPGATCATAAGRARTVERASAVGGVGGASTADGAAVMGGAASAGGVAAGVGVESESLAGGEHDTRSSVETSGKIRCKYFIIGDKSSWEFDMR